MSGIVGYRGHRDAVTVLLAGLHRLEYRGSGLHDEETMGDNDVQDQADVVIPIPSRLEWTQLLIAQCCNSLRITSRSFAGVTSTSRGTSPKA